MKIRYRYRFYPTTEQAETLEKVFGCCRFVYNKTLRLRTDAWQKEQKSIGYHESSSYLTQWKKEPETIWLNDVSCVPTQQSLRHLNSAFMRFWDKTSKYPNFKKKKHKQSAEYTRSAFKWNRINSNLIISGLGRLNIVWCRKFQSIPTTVTIIKESSGKYFVTLVLDEIKTVLPKTGDNVGIDLGINRLATLSNGEFISNPRYLGKKMEKLNREQRIFSRRKKGSGRWNRQRIKVAKIHEQISNNRMDRLHKVTTDIVQRFDRISIEDLNIRGMMSNHKLARAIADVGMYSFRSMLEYKCSWYEKELILVNRFFPSSKRCNVCGHIVGALPLSIREWECPKCKSKHDRDHNAAINIACAEGHSVQARGEIVRRTRPTGLVCKSY